jgi:5-methyltetrahydropteroyltriglutamate--homocysteine methyltransferase
MAAKMNPPFHAEHIGSLLRPAELLQARAAHDSGKLSDEALKDVEDRHIREAVKLQEDVGLEIVSDGEFRRYYYFDHFPAAVSGFTKMGSALLFRNEQDPGMQYTTPVVTGKIKRLKGIATDEYLYVASLTRKMPKVTLPSPCSQHYFRWRQGISEKAYPHIEEFFADVAAVYQEELRDLAKIGAGEVQFDDVSLPLLCDDKLRADFAQRGYDPDEWIGKYIGLVNDALKNRPAGLTVGMHLCRGNNQGKWLGEGGYDYVAERLFNELDLDFFCMEYDSPRAGSFAPLRFVPKDKVVVLGLISSKVPAMEKPDDLKKRIDEAAVHVDLARLALSPQCGFASTAPGNPITPEVQEAKLRLVVDVAKSVWS